MTHTTTLQRNHVSAIKVFSLFQNRIAEINAYPLIPDNIVIQKDAYRRLGSIDDEAPHEDEDAWAIFAEFEQGRKESDDTMRFAVGFTAVGLVVSIEGTEERFFAYDAFGDAHDVVTQIVTMLIMLANGQLALLHTNREGQWCATEVLLYDKDNENPLVIISEAEYPRRWSSKSDEGYECHLLRNDFPIEHIEYPADFFMINKKSDGSFYAVGRKLTGSTLTPLTKGAYEAYWSDIASQLKINDGGKNETEAMLWAWEYWTLVVLGTVAALAGAAALDAPKYVYYLFPGILWIVMFIAAIPTYWILIFKAGLRDYEATGHWLLRLDRAVQGVLTPIREKLLLEKSEDDAIKKQQRTIIARVAGVAGLLFLAAGYGFYGAYAAGLPDWFYLVPFGAGLFTLLVAALTRWTRLPLNAVNLLAYLPVGVTAYIGYEHLGDYLLPGPIAAWVLHLVALAGFALVTDVYTLRYRRIR